MVDAGVEEDPGSEWLNTLCDSIFCSTSWGMVQFTTWRNEKVKVMFSLSEYQKAFSFDEYFTKI